MFVLTRFSALPDLPDLELSDDDEDEYNEAQAGEAFGGYGNRKILNDFHHNQVKNDKTPIIQCF